MDCYDYGMGRSGLGIYVAVQGREMVQPPANLNWEGSDIAAPIQIVFVKIADASSIGDFLRAFM